MAHLRKTASGNLMKTATGRLALGRACSECTHCSGCGANTADCPKGCCTPCVYRVTFASVVACSSCIDCGLGGSIDNIVLPTINTSHDLIQDSVDACLWTRNIGNMTWDEYSSDDCSGTPSSQSQALQIDLQKTAANNWTLHVWSGSLSHAIFQDSVIAASASNRCDETLNAMNGLSCDCDIAVGFPYFVHLSDSGTATIVACV